jgi:hypothetical protein
MEIIVSLDDSIWIDGAPDFEIELNCRFAKLAFDIISDFEYSGFSAEDTLVRLKNLKEETLYKWFDEKYKIVEAN